jgi:hypothetical protein
VSGVRGGKRESPTGWSVRINKSYCGNKQIRLCLMRHAYYAKRDSMFQGAFRIRDCSAGREGTNTMIGTLSNRNVIRLILTAPPA